MVDSPLRTVSLLVAFGCAILAGLALPGKNPGNPVLAVIAGVVAVALVVVVARLWPPHQRTLKVLAVSSLMFFAFALATIINPILASSRVVRDRSICLSNVKRLSVAAQMYLVDWDDRFPISTQWSTSLDPYDAGIGDLRCPLAKTPYSYAMNSGLSAKTLDGDYAIAALFFDADAWGPSASGGREWLARRHGGNAFVGCADGSVKAVGRDRLNDLRWTP